MSLLRLAAKLVIAKTADSINEEQRKIEAGEIVGSKLENENNTDDIISSMLSGGTVTSPPKEKDITDRNSRQMERARYNLKPLLKELKIEDWKVIDQIALSNVAPQKFYESNLSSLINYKLNVEAGIRQDSATALAVLHYSKPHKTIERIPVQADSKTVFLTVNSLLKNLYKKMIIVDSEFGEISISGNWIDKTSEFYKSGEEMLTTLTPLVNQLGFTLCKLNLDERFHDLFLVKNKKFNNVYAKSYNAMMKLDRV